MKDFKDWRFLMKLFHKHLVPTWDPPFPFHFVWNPWVPSKVSFFTWEAPWGRVLTLDI